MAVIPCPVCAKEFPPDAMDLHLDTMHPSAAPATPAGRPDLLLTTTPAVEGRPVLEVHGPVFGEAILGANVFSDMASSVRDVVGGRSASYEGKIARAREIAIEEMALGAHRTANAVVGIRVDYESLRGSMLMVTAQGTAVTIGPSSPPEV